MSARTDVEAHALRCREAVDRGEERPRYEHEPTNRMPWEEGI